MSRRKLNDNILKPSSNSTLYRRRKELFFNTIAIDQSNRIRNEIYNQDNSTVSNAIIQQNGLINLALDEHNLETREVYPQITEAELNDQCLNSYNLNENYFYTNDNNVEFNSNLDYSTREDVISLISSPNNLNKFNDITKNILNDLIKFYSKNSINKSNLEKVIKLINVIIENTDKIDKSFPKSIYKLLQIFDSNISIVFSFKCLCGKDYFNFKSTSSPIECPTCPTNSNIYTIRKIFSTKNYTFRFNLSQQLKLILNTFKLSDDYPGEVFKKFKNEKAGNQICCISIFIDGVPILGDYQIWNLFVKVNNISASIYSKIFLNSCLLSDKKPNGKTIDFFLSDLVIELNEMFNNGIYIRSINKVVYVVFTLFLLDFGARPAFINHTYFNGAFGCNLCYHKGETFYTRSGHTHIYPPEAIQLRTLERHNKILDLIENDGINPPILGVKGRAFISKVEHFNQFDSCTTEPMHMIKGIISMFFDCSLKEKTKLCYFNKEIINILEKRILNFSKSTYCSIFKRSIEKFSNNQKWKANQVFQFYFYIAPIVFKDLINQDVYKFNVLLMYIISNLWYKENVNLVYMGYLINILNQLVELYYPRTCYTPNIHQMNHLIKFYVDHGPLSLNNAFIYEHLNGIISNLVNSGFGVLEQIADRVDKEFIRNLNQIEKTPNFNFKTKNKTNNITKIENDKLFVSSKKINKSNDYYIKANDKFYEILEIYENENRQFELKAKEFKILDNFSIRLNFSEVDIEDYQNDKLKLSYIFKVIQLREIVNLPANLIQEKVLFCPEFKRNSSDFVNASAGYIIRDVINLHN